MRLATMMTPLVMLMEIPAQATTMPIQEDAEVMTLKTLLLQENAVHVEEDQLDIMKKASTGGCISLTQISMVMPLFGLATAPITHFTSGMSLVLPAL